MDIVIAKHRNKIEREIKDCEKIIAGSPNGKLIYTKNGKYSKWYMSDGKKITYIPKKKRELAQKLAEKGLALTRLKALKSEKYACDLYLRHHKNPNVATMNYYCEKGIFQDLLSNNYLISDQRAQKWINEPFLSNRCYSENLIHRSASGNMVRSKSEMLIDSILYKNKIPFRYECELLLGSSVIYPDFTIYNFRTGELLYWEHFGMLDNPVYFKSFISKLQLYATHGIYPGEKLIVTFETGDSPLMYEEVESIVRRLTDLMGL